MNELHEFECPACGGVMEFDAESQSLRCPYCGSTMDIDEYEKTVRQPADPREESRENADQPPREDSPEKTDPPPQEDGTGWTAGETENMRVYACESCGAEVVGELTEAAGCCPYCGSNILMKGQFQDALKPDGVIPFQLDKQAARAAYKKHLQGKKLLPACFRSENHIKKIQGLYVPFWLFDADVYAEVNLTGERTTSRTSGRTTYTNHRVYSICRGGNLRFRGIPTDGSQKMDDALMEAIEPFDPEKILPYRSAYMAGYRADRYDVDEEQRRQRVEQRIRASAVSSLVSQVSGYETTSAPELELQIRSLRSRYVLYPVWILSSRWRGKTFTFAMNGQTGKMVGDLPMDVRAFWLRLVGLAAAISAGIYGVVAMLISLA